MTDTEKVRDLISSKGLKLQYVAKILGITPYSLTMKLKNRTEFKTSEVSALCDLLEVNDLKQKDALFFAAKVD